MRDPVLEKTYDRLDRKYPPEDVLPLIIPPDQRNVKKNQLGKIDGYDVNIASNRLRNFRANGTTCVRCGIEASFFVLERQKVNPTARYHLNLYAVDETGLEILMTQDHIVPRSRGGPDNVNNLQTMCYPCNQRKDS